MLILLIGARFRELKNYLWRRLDRMTRIEIVIAVVVGTFFFSQTVTSHVDAMLRNGPGRSVWQNYHEFNAFLFGAIFVSNLLTIRKSMRKLRNGSLLLQTTPAKTLAQYWMFETAAPALSLLPFWLIWHGTFLFRIAPFTHALAITAGQMLAYIAISCLGLLHPLLWSEKSNVPGRSARRCAGWLATAWIAGWYFLPMHAQTGTDSLLFLLRQTLTAMALWALLFASLYQRIISDPESLQTRIKSRALSRLPGLLLGLFLWPVPALLKPMVRKDMLYAARRYKLYIFTIVFFFSAMAVALLRAGVREDALQWQLFLTIAFAYFLSNIAFGFYDTRCENLAFLKSTPIRASHIWWSKFCIAFLPLLWFIVIGHILLLAAYPLDGWSLALNLALCFSLAITFIFIQNNFSLYSYPYSRYAAAWYNLYLLTGALFFTILLFPPLAIGFLIYGYVAIFRVQKRIKQWVPG